MADRQATGSFDPAAVETVGEAVEPRTRRAGRLARSTAFFSLATGLSRVAGLVREIVAASYFGVKGPMSAFTIAFQVPNLVRRPSGSPRR
jgi:putative peptidoglycan lipid II flippase